MPNSFVKRAVSLCSAAAMISGFCGEFSAIAPFSVSAEQLNVCINEICTGNSGENGNLTDAVDKNGEYCDWIELYNPSDADIDISGWSLIKDDADTYSFSDVTVPAGGYTIVYCCKTYKGDESVPHAAFNLSGSGVKLTLADTDGLTDSVDVPALDKDTVYARKPDGSENFLPMLPSPNGTNNESKVLIPCNAPVFSAESGMYGSAFDLTLETDEGNTIYYTLDGTDPATSSTRIEYTGAINIYNRSSDPSTMARRVAVNKITPWNNGGYLPNNSDVDKGTVIRACTYSKADEYSETITKSYFVGVSNATHNNLPIMSVTTDPDNLFDYEKGINVLGKVYDDYIKTPGWNRDNPEANYNQRGQEWERPCHIDFFEEDGTLVLSQDCGMRTQGAYSRADYQKSFRFYARADYGAKNFKYPFFGEITKMDGSGEPLDKYKKIVMRNGGNDTFYAKFKDTYIQKLLNDRAFDTQAGRPCVMFIDGEYWGLYTLQEDFTDSYFEENYGVNKDEVIVYKKGEIDEGLEEDIVLFKDMKHFARDNDLSDPENYAKMCEMLDIDSFIDYMAAEIYIINEDWPGNNYAMWRVRNTDDTVAYADGKWRCLLYDTEMGVDHYGNSSTKYNVDNLKKILANDYDDLTVLFRNLMENEEFKEKFVTAFMDIANVNFNYQRTLDEKQYYMNTYYKEMDKFFKRFPTWANRGNATDPCLDRMDYFLSKRPSYVPTMLKNNLSLSTAVSVKISALNPEGGNVRINTSTLDLSSTFTGKYFPDYNITLSAEAKEGYTFAGWRGSVISDEAQISISPEKASEVQAIFVREGEENNICKITFTDGTTRAEIYAVKGGDAEIPYDLFKKEGYNVSFSPSPTNVQGDMTCNAVYTGVNYKVRYLSNGGTGTMAVQNMVYGTPAKLSANKFTRSGYVFAGWGKRSNVTTPDFAPNETVVNLASTEGKTVTLYAIWKKNISSCTISGVESSYIYDGKAIRPTVTVKNGTTTLVKGTDYTVTYTGGTSCGYSYVTVTGKGAYTGSKKISYLIKPGNVTVTQINRSTTAVRLFWNEVKGADKYEIYKQTGATFKKIGTTAATEYRDAGMAAGTAATYRIRAVSGTTNGAFTSSVTCTRTAVPKLAAASASKGKATLSWNKVSNASGFQLLMSPTKNGTYTSIKYPQPTTVKYTKTGLTSGKTYYFRIRSFRTVDGKKYYSYYSSPVGVKIK
ncbi:MAG: CotH kinase family protein [Oscillospiraceae bacterium]